MKKESTKKRRPFDSDLPDFQYNSLEEAISGLKEWASNRSLGRFDLIVGTKQRGVAPLGNFSRVELKCSRFGRHRTTSQGIRSTSSKKCNCPWKLSIYPKKFEDGKVKWVRGYMHDWPTNGISYSESDSHGGTHTLVKGNQVSSGALSRTIPLEFESDIALLVEAGMSPNELYKYLVKQCELKSIQVKFVMKDVINRVAKLRPNSDLVFDLTDLVKCLADRRQQNASLHYDIRTCRKDNNQAVTDCIFFTTDGALELWKSSEGKTVVLYDTKHGTNRYGFYLGLISMVDFNGKTRILAVSLIKNQDQSSFEWVFKNFLVAFKTHPSVMFTDSDAAMKAAIAEVFLQTIHLLCIFHIWKNFYAHVMPLIRYAIMEDRQRLNKTFLTLAKDSDDAMTKTFDVEFGKCLMK